MNAVLRTYKFIRQHPLSRKNKMAAYRRWLKWQILSKIFPFPVQLPFVENTSLLVQRNMTGATGNYYVGLHEFEDMAFLLHFLRKEDVFCDIGANIGSYTILASGVTGASSFAFEPVPATFRHLRNNISINSLELLVKTYNLGLDKKEGQLYFTSGLDTVNHAVAEGEPSEKTIRVKVSRLDTILQTEVPALIKIDVEGFEKYVLEGAQQTLSSPGLKAIIIELNGSGGRYGINEDEVHQMLLKLGFYPHSYEPFQRTLTRLHHYGSLNTIYIRDLEYVQNRIAKARKFSVNGVTL